MNPSSFLPRFFLLLSLAVLLSSTANATLTDGSLSPDFTLTDINGNVFNLYQQLESGKTVFVEFIAGWDENCWNYHHAQHLQSLYAQHGPSGTCSDDVIVVLIEADLTSGLDVLDGTSPIAAGNWITDTPYPIFNPTSDEILDDFLVTTFPTIYRICPSKIVKSNGQISAGAHAATIDGCSITNDIKISEDSPFYYCSGLVEPKVVIRNVAYPLGLTQASISVSIDGVEQTPVVWNGSTNPGTEVLFSLPQLSLSPGLHVIDCNIDNLSENAVDLNQANNCIQFNVFVNESVFDASNVNQDFSSELFPYESWISDNPDQSNTWMHSDHEGGMLLMDFYTYGDLDQVDALLAGPVNLTEADASFLSFDVAYAPYSDLLFDGLGVAVSTDCGLSWSQVYYKEGVNLATAGARTEPFFPLAGNWRSECIDLSNFTSEESVLVSFIGFNGWGNQLFLDNVSFGSSCVVDVSEQISAESDFAIYPNPVAGELFVMSDELTNELFQCELYDMSGKLIKSWNCSQPIAANTFSLDCSPFENGLYTLRLNGRNSVFSTRVVVAK
jgi:hypothetical protein